MPHAARMVLLLHELPDGSSHFDWMIARPGKDDAGSGPDARVLLCFRVRERIDGPEATEFVGQRLGDHRALYLDYQGPLTGGRGVVARVATGVVIAVTDRDHWIEIRGWFEGQPEATWLGTAQGSAWRFERCRGVLNQGEGEKGGSRRRGSPQ